MTIKVLYDGEHVGTVHTNQSLTTWEVIELAGIDIEEMVGEDTRMYDPELFELVYE